MSTRFDAPDSMDDDARESVWVEAKEEVDDEASPV